VKLHISNLGRIRDAELDIRPLTVFLGPNHTNKTWSAYALYGIARNLARIEFSMHRRLGFKPNEAIKRKIEAAAEQLVQDLTEKPDLNITRTLTRKDLIEGISVRSLTLALDVHGLSAILGVPESRLADASVEAILEQEEFEHSVFSALELTYKPSDLEVASRFWPSILIVKCAANGLASRTRNAAISFSSSRARIIVL
jgi:hypothetical protein